MRATGAGSTRSRTPSAARRASAWRSPPGRKLAIEDLHAHCLNALKTETQVMVRREDEQAFAELNGAYIKFVEDAARLLYRELDRDPRIRDFQVACAHLESLHSHDAVSVICKGVKGGFAADFMDFEPARVLKAEPETLERHEKQIEPRIAWRGAQSVTNPQCGASACTRSPWLRRSRSR